MGIDANTVSLMQRFGIKGHGASFGYPHFVDRKLPKEVRKQPSEHVFEELGVTIEVFDVGPLKDHDITILDLNEPVHIDYWSQFDFIINPGTFEHVFNVGQAFMNSWKMTRVGGLGFHHGSVGRPKLGYWNMTVNTWREWCRYNGELLHFEENGKTYYAVTKRGGLRPEWPQENNVR